VQQENEQLDAFFALQLEANKRLQTKGCKQKAAGCSRHVSWFVFLCFPLFFLFTVYLVSVFALDPSKWDTFPFEGVSTESLPAGLRQPLCGLCFASPSSGCWP